MLLLETLRCEEGEVLHLPFHQRRLDESLRTLGIAETFDLASLISPPETGVWRCRFLYGAEGSAIEFHPYTPRAIRTLKLVESDFAEYPLKYADRTPLEALFSLRGTSDDVLIVRNGLLTDTTIANVALFIDGRWFTPNTPLLRGTTRQRLIGEGFLHEAVLRREEIFKAEKVAVMNAMMGFVEVENGIIV